MIEKGEEGMRSNLKLEPALAENYIFMIPSRQVMIDRDLAGLYWRGNKRFESGGEKKYRQISGKIPISACPDRKRATGHRL